MSVGENIKKLRQQRNIKQQELADLIGMHRSNYSKIESSQRELSITALNKIARFFDITLDDLVNMEDDIPQEVIVENKTALEKLKALEEMDEEDRNLIFRMIDTILTKKKFKDFFQKNVASL